MQGELCSLIEQEVGHFFVLEKLDGSKISIPIIHLNYFQLNGAQLELNFSYHTIVIEGLFIDILFDLLISGKSAYVKEFGERYESMSKPESLYISKAEVMEIER